MFAFLGKTLIENVYYLCYANIIIIRINVLTIQFFPFFLSIVEIVARNDRHIIKGLHLCFLILAN